MQRVANFGFARHAGTTATIEDVSKWTAKRPDPRAGAARHVAKGWLSRFAPGNSTPPHAPDPARTGSRPTKE